jgi:hypothetical protein
MLHGEIDDLGNEFFIQKSLKQVHYNKTTQYDNNNNTNTKDTFGGLSGNVRNLYEEVLNKMNRGASASKNYVNKNENIIFDWYSSYTLRLEYLPESHISPRMASKILFAGKAVKLLQSSLSTSNYMSTPDKLAVYSYLARGYGYISRHSSVDKDKKNHDNISVNISDINTNISLNGINNNNINENNNEEKKENDVFLRDYKDDITLFKQYNEYFESCGYNNTDINEIMEKFRNIYRFPSLAIELFESLVNDINSKISAKLWVLLRDNQRFDLCLQTIRSTYLIGRGELFQSIIDGIFRIMDKDIEEDQKDNILSYEVMKDTAKLLNLDEEIFAEMLVLKINNNNINIKHFLDDDKKNITLTGTAILDASTGRVLIINFENIDSQTSLNKNWIKNHLKRANIISPSLSPLSNVYKDNNQSVPISNPFISPTDNFTQYCNGSIWLNNPKNITKGNLFL